MENIYFHVGAFFFGAVSLLFAAGCRTETGDEGLPANDNSNICLMSSRAFPSVGVRARVHSFLCVDDPMEIIENRE